MTEYTIELDVANDAIEGLNLEANDKKAAIVDDAKKSFNQFKLIDYVDNVGNGFPQIAFSFKADNKADAIEQFQNYYGDSDIDDFIIA